MKQFKKFMIFVLVLGLGLILLDAVFNEIFNVSLTPYLEKIANFKL